MLSILLLTCAADSLTLFPPDKKPADKRLGPVRTLHDKDFFLKVPASGDAWLRRAKAVREQMFVSQGLWPMWAREKLSPTVSNGVVRDGYRVDAVHFASTPGHYVTGSLYRPTDKDGTVKPGTHPAVLVAHGHWADGRMHDAGEAAAKKELKSNAESHLPNARYFLQAKCAHLARLGCVVFQYDMIGYADSKVIGHGGWGDVEAELRLQNLMGLQSFNSLRALDFLASRPEVDATRIGMTGASGGGTQTFMTAALDERIAAAVPAVMVSTQMQGGCVCENASYLRVGTGNVEFAALMVPRPLGLTAANDWTIEIEKKGYPELQGIYRLFEAEAKVKARCWPEFGHNYNQPARQFTYEFFNEHLKLGHKTPIVEPEFKPLTRAEQTAFPTKESRPSDALPVDRLRQKLAEASDAQIEALVPTDGKSLAAARAVLEPALRVMLGGGLPETKELITRAQGTPSVEGAEVKGYVIGRKGSGEQVPVAVLRSDSKKFNGQVIVWVSPGGKADLVKGGKLIAEAKAALDGGAAIVAPDVFNTGELTPETPPAVNPKFPGYTFGYNRPLLAQRCHDILTAVALAKKEGKTVHLLGEGKAGPWVLLARGLCGDAVTRCAVDLDRFRFDRVKDAGDEMMLPGALKYGGLGALGSLAAPGELYTHNHEGTGTGKWLNAAYKAADAEKKNEKEPKKVETAKVVGWLLR